MNITLQTKVKNKPVTCARVTVRYLNEDVVFVTQGRKGYALFLRNGTLAWSWGLKMSVKGRCLRIHPKSVDRLDAFGLGLIPDKGVNTLCPYCAVTEQVSIVRRREVKLHFSCVGGMRLTREKGGRNVYAARCPQCGRTWEVDGGKVK